MSSKLKLIIGYICLFLSLTIGVAFAESPFADVPKSNWSYSAVSYLASRHMVVGYPDGNFKGDKLATRYEMAAMTARIMNSIDLTKADKKDLEVLSKLVDEYHNELVALGVKVNTIDGRVFTLEDRLGGWKLNGNMTFRADYSDRLSDNTDWNFNKARLNFKRYIDDKSYVNMRIRGDHDLNTLKFDLMYVQFALPYDITARIGKQNIDLIGSNNMTFDNEPMFGNDYLTAFKFDKNFNKGSVTVFVAHQEAVSGDVLKDTDINFTNYFGNAIDNYYNYGMNFNYNLTDKLSTNLYASVWDFDTLNSFYIWGVNGKYSWNDNVIFNLGYWQQGLDSTWVSTFNETSPNAWQASIYVAQNQLKFTDLVVQYSMFEKGWLIYNDMYGTYTPNMTAFADTFGVPGFVNDANSLFVGLNQKWNDKWTTHVRYVNTGMDSDNFLAPNGADIRISNRDFQVQELGVGVTYQYNSAMSFSLFYDNVDYSDGLEVYGNYKDDNIVRFQTVIVF